METKQTATIENAQIINNRLFGTVYGHPTIADGAEIATSPVVDVHINRDIVETNNTIYTVKSWNTAPTTGVDINV